MSEIAQPFLRIEGLSKRFGTFTALKDIDLEVRRGEFVCFLGPSGCGKTTLLRAIAGLDRQDEGKVILAGRDVSDAPPAERDFGIVFQSYALFPNLTVGRNVAYGLVNRRRSSAEIKRRVDELLALVGLADQEHKYPVQLSGGQQQRVALARALATSPGLLLLDEPLSALDAKVRVRLRDEIRALQRRLGVTTIMVTHDQEEALAMADRIVVMNQGGHRAGRHAGGDLSLAGDAVRGRFRRAHDLPRRRRDRARNRQGRRPRASRRRPRRAPAGRFHPLGHAPGGRAHAQHRGRHAEPFRGHDRAAFLSRLVLPRRARARGLARHPIAADFSTNAMRDLTIAVGQTRAVAFPPEALRVFVDGVQA